MKCFCSGKDGQRQLGGLQEELPRRAAADHDRGGQVRFISELSLYRSKYVK